MVYAIYISIFLCLWIKVQLSLADFAELSFFRRFLLQANGQLRERTGEVFFDLNTSNCIDVKQLL